jgi:hypothetical protein
MLRQLGFRALLRGVAVAAAVACSVPAAASAQDAGAGARGDRLALELGLSVIIPLEGYADRQPGIGVEAGLWVEIERLLLMPTLALRQSISGRDETYTHVALDFMLGYLVTDAENALFLGGGLGPHALYERVYVERSVGTVFRSTSSDVIEDFIGGASLFARAGVAFWRTSTVTLIVSADYAVTFANFQERSSEQAVRINVALAVGG